MGLLEANQLVGNYRVVRKIGAGGMGEVWEAVHAQIGSRAALKVLLPKYSHEPEVAARFFNEARAVNVVGHPGLVTIFDFGTLPSGACYIAMEYLDGETLTQRIERKGRLGPEALRIARQTASALAAAHAKGIVHRDLKPENLFIIADPEAASGERVKILDFGIAKMVRKPTPDETAPARTSPDAFMGTPQYMSPEQCRGAGAVQEKSDVYSLGIIVYEMLSGHLPFPPDTPVGELIAMHLYGHPPSLMNLDPTITEDISAMVDSMLSKPADERPSMQELVRQLESLGAPKATGPMPKISWGPENKVVIPPYPPSTLGNSSGQRNSQRNSQRGRKPAVRSRVAIAVTVVLGMVAIIGSSLLVHKYYSPSESKPAVGESLPISRPIKKIEPPAVTPTDEQDSPAPPASKHPDLSTATILQVHWAIVSEPPGAEILLLDSGIVLGKTPYEADRNPVTGAVRLRLRLRNYKDKDLVVEGGQNYKTSELLQPQSKTPNPGTHKWKTDAEDTRMIPLFPEKLDSSRTRAD